MYINELCSLGLTENEAKAYFMISEEGKITAPKLQKKLDLSLVSTHAILDSLQEMDIIKAEKFGKREYFFINNPKSLLDLIELEKKHFLDDLEEKKEIAQKIIPTLSTLYNLQFEEFKIKFHKGPNGMLQVRKMISELKNETVYELANFDTNPFQEEKRGDFISAFRKRKIQFITFFTSKGASKKPEFSGDIIKYMAYLPYEEYGTLPADLYIIKDKIVILLNTPKAPILVIESTRAAETLKMFFKVSQNHFPNLMENKK